MRIKLAHPVPSSRWPAIAFPRLSRRAIVTALSCGCTGVVPIRRHRFNGPEQEGVGYFQLNFRNGWRCSTATAYLKPTRRLSGLQVVTGALCTSVVMARAHRHTSPHQPQWSTRRRHQPGRWLRTQPTGRGTTRSSVPRRNAEFGHARLTSTPLSGLYAVLLPVEARKYGYGPHPVTRSLLLPADPRELPCHRGRSTRRHRRRAPGPSLACRTGDAAIRGGGIHPGVRCMRNR